MDSDAMPVRPQPINDRCPRCQGVLFARTDAAGAYLTCLVCGHTQAFSTGALLRGTHPTAP